MSATQSLNIMLPLKMAKMVQKRCFLANTQLKTIVFKIACVYQCSYEQLGKFKS